MLFQPLADLMGEAVLRAVISIRERPAETAVGRCDSAAKTRTQIAEVDATAGATGSTRQKGPPAGRGRRPRWCSELGVRG